MLLDRKIKRFEMIRSLPFIVELLSVYKTTDKSVNTNTQLSLEIHNPQAGYPALEGQIPCSGFDPFT